MTGSSLWKKVCLGDLISVKHGWPFKSQYFSEQLTGRPIVVNIGNFEYTGGFRFDTTTVREYQAEYPPEYELQPGDILLVMTCQTSGGEILGIPARIPDDDRVYLHNQRLGKVNPVSPDVDTDFLYWLFLWPEFNRELYLSSTGTKILHTSPGRIQAFRFRLPPLPIQRRIAGILGALDDKIEVNRRINRVLEAMAQALYKHWFVDLGPFQDGEFVESELGLIPAGWRTSTIGNMSDVFLGGDWGEEQPKGDSIHPARIIRGTDFPSLRLGQAGGCPLRYIKESSTKKRQLAHGDIIIENSVNATSRAAGSSLLINRGILNRLGGRTSIVCASFCRMLRLRTPALAPLVYLQLRHLYDTGEITRFQNIASNGIANFQAQRFAEALVLLPPPKELETFIAAVAPLLDNSHVSENYLLSQIRDHLLPKLLSGEVRVDVAEELVA